MKQVYAATETASLQKNDHLRFVLRRILDIRTARCTISNEAFVIHTHIIQTLGADEDGYIYFHLYKPVVILEHVDRFNIDLVYYKKNIGYRIEVNAMASFVHDHHEARTSQAAGHQKTHMETMLVKAKIIEAVYHEDRQPVLKNLLQIAAHRFHSFSRHITAPFAH